jgi:hypothetical protein
MAPGSRKQIDVARLKGDLSAARVDLLSAHCATDRVRLQYSPPDIVAFGEQHSLRRAIASPEAVCRLFSQIEAHLQPSGRCRTLRRIRFRARFRQNFEHSSRPAIALTSPRV